MQLNAGHIIISYPSLNLSSIQTVIIYYIQIILWTISIVGVCVYYKISDLMYSFKLYLASKKYQMCGQLQNVYLRSGILKRKHLHNKNNCWHFNHCVCGFNNTRMMRNMRFSFVNMSGKFECLHKMIKIVGEHFT